MTRFWARTLFYGLVTVAVGMLWLAWLNDGVGGVLSGAASIAIGWFVVGRLIRG